MGLCVSHGAMRVEEGEGVLLPPATWKLSVLSTTRPDTTAAASSSGAATADTSDSTAGAPPRRAKVQHTLPKPCSCAIRMDGTMFVLDNRGCVHVFHPSGVAFATCDAMALGEAASKIRAGPTAAVHDLLRMSPTTGVNLANTPAVGGPTSIMIGGADDAMIEPLSSPTSSDPGALTTPILGAATAASAASASGNVDGAGLVPVTNANGGDGRVRAAPISGGWAGGADADATEDPTSGSLPAETAPDSSAPRPAKRAPRRSRTATTVGRPGGIALSPDGKVLVVTDARRHRIIVMDADALTVTYVTGDLGHGDGQFDQPCACTVVGDEVYVVDTCNNRIQVLALRDGQVRRAFGSRGMGPECLNRPMDIAPMRTGVLVADMYNAHVKAFSWLGEPLGLPICDLRVKNVFALAVGPPGKVGDHGFLYATSYLGNEVHVFDTEGELVRVIGGGEGSGDGQLSNVGAIALPPLGVEGAADAVDGIDPAGLLLVCDKDNNRVSVFQDGYAWADAGEADSEDEPLLTTPFKPRHRNSTVVALGPGLASPTVGPAALGGSGDDDSDNDVIAADASLGAGVYRVHGAKRVTGYRRRAIDPRVRGLGRVEAPGSDIGRPSPKAADRRSKASRKRTSVARKYEIAPM